MNKNQEIIQTDQTLQELITSIKREVAGTNLSTLKKMELLTLLKVLAFKVEAELAKAECNSTDKILNILNLQFLIKQNKE